jgi:hypothetical protein
MILYPPVRFDLNEWFIIAVTVICWSVYLLLLRDRFSLIILICLWLFNFYLSQTIDFAIAQGHPIDLYNINDLPRYEWSDLFLYIFTYPTVTLFIVWGYVRFRPRGLRLAVYLVAVALVSTGFEAVAWMCNVYHYKGWSLYYSFPLYIVTSAMNIALYRMIVWLLPHGGAISTPPLE